MAEWFSCNGACSGSDPTSDTVKVDAALLAAVGKGKENMQPKQAPEKAHEAQKAWEEQKKKERELKAAEERRRLEDEANRRRQEEEARLRLEEEAAASEREAAERVRREREAAEAAARVKEAERQAEEKARMLSEAAERVRAEREAADKEEKRQANEKVSTWCKKNGFVNMSTQKKTMFSGSKFPLHKAVSSKDAEMVRMMVLLDVDRSVKNSKGQTPADLAASLNKDRSMDAIIACLK